MRGLTDQCARCRLKQFGANIKFDKGQPQRFAPFQRFAIALHCRLVGRRSVGVEAHLVAIFAAQQLVAGDAINLAHEIPQGNFNAGDAAAFTPPVAEFFEGAEDHINVAGILAEQHALELERIFAVTSVAHLAQAIDALIRVNAEDGVVIVAGNHGNAHVGDFEVGRL